MEPERLIAKYFLNELTAEEKIHFDKLMDSDLEFQKKVLFEEKVKKGIFVKEHTIRKAHLQNIEEGLASKTNKLNWYLAAASIVVLLSIGFLWNLNSASTDKLFDSYYKTASNTTHPLIRNNTATNDVTEAFIAYESKEYEDAIALLKKAFSGSNNSELMFYQGICYLEIGETDLAIKTFKKHIVSNDRLFGKSKWYLSLAYLKLNDLENSKTILEEITSDSSNYNYDKARNLIKKL